ncbi:MAG: hypothetical protein ABI988_16555, partial [Nitrospirota bacterium]
LPPYHARVMVRATEPGTAFIPWVGTSLAEILCVQDERGVAKDNTPSYHRALMANTRLALRPCRPQELWRPDTSIAVFRLI